MRILFWTEQFYPDLGGVEVLSYHLIHILRQQKHEFLVITSQRIRFSTVTDSHEPGLTVHRFPFRQTMQSNQLPEIRNIVEKISDLIESFMPDIIHLNTQSISLFFLERVLKLPNFHSIPVLYSLHAPLQLLDYPELNRHKKSLLGRMLEKAKHVICVSHSLHDAAVKIFPEFESKIDMIYNGLPLPDVSQSTVDFLNPHLLCIGRIVPEKGFDLAIRAMPSILQNFPNVRLTIAGDGTEKKALEKLVYELDIGQNVSFLGWVEPSQILALINSANIVLMPSRWHEPFGLVALQTALMKRPIIATRDGGIPEIVTNGETGILINRDDIEGLTSSVVHLLKNQDVAKQMGEKAWKRARCHFDIEACVQKYSQMYDHCVRG